MTPSANAPFFDWRGNSFSNSAREVGKWRQLADLEPVMGVSVLILHMDPVARKVCLAAGRGEVMDPDGAIGIAQSLNEAFSPCSAESAYQEAARSLRCKRAFQTMDGNAARFDLLPTARRRRCGWEGPPR